MNHWARMDHTLCVRFPAQEIRLDSLYLRQLKCDRPSTVPGKCKSSVLSYLFMIFYDFPTINSLANRTRRAFRLGTILRMQVPCIFPAAALVADG